MYCSEILFVGLFRKVALWSHNCLLTEFFREYSGQISPLRNFTGLKFVLATIVFTVVWCEFLHVI